MVGQEYVKCRSGPKERMVGYTRVYWGGLPRGGGTQWQKVSCNFGWPLGGGVEGAFQARGATRAQWEQEAGRGCSRYGVIVSSGC